MSWSKAKNIIILILIAADLLLCSLAVPISRRLHDEDRQLGLRLEQLFAEKGISLNADILLQGQSLSGLELVHGSQAAGRAVTALLRQVVLVQDDSSRYLSTYSGSGGSCTFSLNGEFNATVTQPSDSSPDDAQDLLTDMSFSASSLAAVFDEDGIVQLQAIQSIFGLPVYGPGLTLTYHNGSLVSLDGYFYLWDDEPVLVSQQTCLSPADALLAFLNGRSSLGWVGRQVLLLEQGWLVTETPSASAVQLTPAWRITTDTDVVYVDGLSGSLTVQ